jgi:hypothetical protein
VRRLLVTASVVPSSPILVTLMKVVFLRSVSRLLVTASVAPSSPIVATLRKEALSFSETSVLTRATRRNIRKYFILQPEKYLIKWLHNFFPSLLLAHISHLHLATNVALYANETPTI